LSIDLQQNSWLSEVRTVAASVGVVDKRLWSPECGCPTLRGFRRVGSPTSYMPNAVYRFAWPRAIFLTLGFFDPRGYSRGLSGFSALRFLREARLVFLRSSRDSFVVLAMIPFELSNLVIE